MATICREVAQLHPRLRSDLLLSAALLHDVGRVRELGPRSGLARRRTKVACSATSTSGCAPWRRRPPSSRAAARTELLHAIAVHHDARAARTAEAATLVHANQLDAVAATRPVPES